MRLMPGDLVTVNREFGMRVDLYTQPPHVADAETSCQFWQDDVGIVVSSHVSAGLGTNVVYVVCPQGIGWAIVASLKKL